MVREVGARALTKHALNVHCGHDDVYGRPVSYAPNTLASSNGVVTLARESGAELAVRSGGHSLAGHSVSEGGIVLDLADIDYRVQSLPLRGVKGTTGTQASSARPRLKHNPATRSPASTVSARLLESCP